MDILDIHHLGLSVSNLKATSEFFTMCLNWSIARKIPEYPAIFVTNGKTLITLWQTNSDAQDFDLKRNVGLHHFALEVSSEEALDAVFNKAAEFPGVKIEFKPELLRDGPAKHCMIYEPGGIRMEFIWIPES